MPMLLWNYCFVTTFTVIVSVTILCSECTSTSFIVPLDVACCGRVQRHGRVYCRRSFGVVVRTVRTCTDFRSVPRSALSTTVHDRGKLFLFQKYAQHAFVRRTQHPP